MPCVPCSWETQFEANKLGGLSFSCCRQNTSECRYFEKHQKQCLKLFKLFREVTISFVSITFNRLICFFRTVKQNRYTNVFCNALTYSGEPVIGDACMKRFSCKGIQPRTFLPSLSPPRTRWVDVVEHPFSRNRSITPQRPFYTCRSFYQASSFRWEFREPERWSPSKLDEMGYETSVLPFVSLFHHAFSLKTLLPMGINVQRLQVSACGRIVILCSDKKREAIINKHTEKHRTSPFFSWMQSFPVVYKMSMNSYNFLPSNAELFCYRCLQI